MFVTNYSYYRRLALATVICCQGLIASESSQALTLLQAGSGLSAHAQSSQPHTSFFADMRRGAFELKQATVERWNDLPTWGKCAVVGTTATVALLGSMWVIKHMRGKRNTWGQSVPVLHEDDFEELIKQPTTSPPVDLRSALSMSNAEESKTAAAQFLGHDDAAQRVALKEEYQKIIGEPYTAERAVIIENILGYQALFKQADWFDLWQYACKHEPEEGQNRFRNLLGHMHVHEIRIHVSDTQTIIDALRSRVKWETPVTLSDEDLKAFSSSASSSLISSEEAAAPLLFAAAHLCARDENNLELRDAIKSVLEFATRIPGQGYARNHKQLNPIVDEIKSWISRGHYDEVALLFDLLLENGVETLGHQPVIFAEAAAQNPQAYCIKAANALLLSNEQAYFYSESDASSGLLGLRQRLIAKMLQTPNYALDRVHSLEIEGVTFAELSAYVKRGLGLQGFVKVSSGDEYRKVLLLAVELLMQDEVESYAKADDLFRVIWHAKEDKESEIKNFMDTIKHWIESDLDDAVLYMHTYFMIRGRVSYLNEANSNKAQELRDYAKKLNKRELVKSFAAQMLASNNYTLQDLPDYIDPIIISEGDVAAIKRYQQRSLPHSIPVRVVALAQGNDQSEQDSGAASSTASAERLTTFGELYNATVAPEK